MLFVAGIAITAGWVLLKDAGRTTPVEPGALRVTVSMSGFNPSSLSTTVSTPVRVNLINLDNQYHTDGGGRHNFVLVGTAVSIVVEPLGQAVITLPADAPGTYEWYCDICCGGRDNPAMVGSYTVNP